MEAKLRHLWGFSVTWWKVMPMHNAWEEREDFVWLLFIDHQSSAAAHTHTYRDTYTRANRLTRCDVTSHRSRKQEQRKKQEYSKLATLSGMKKIKERNNKTKQKCWRAIFRWQDLWCTKPKRGGRGEEGAAGLVFVSEMGFNRNTLYVWSYTLSLRFVPTVPTLRWKCL